MARLVRSRADAALGRSGFLVAQLTQHERPHLDEVIEVIILLGRWQGGLTNNHVMRYRLYRHIMHYMKLV